MRLAKVVLEILQRVLGKNVVYVALVLLLFPDLSLAALRDDRMIEVGLTLKTKIVVLVITPQGPLDMGLTNKSNLVARFAQKFRKYGELRGNGPIAIINGTRDVRIHPGQDGRTRRQAKSVDHKTVLERRHLANQPVQMWGMNHLVDSQRAELIPTHSLTQEKARLGRRGADWFLLESGTSADASADAPNTPAPFARNLRRVAFDLFLSINLPPQKVVPWSGVIASNPSSNKRLNSDAFNSQRPAGVGLIRSEPETTDRRPTFWLKCPLTSLHRNSCQHLGASAQPRNGVGGRKVDTLLPQGGWHKTKDAVDDTVFGATGLKP